MLPGKLPLKQLQVIWHSVINSIIHQRWSGKCYCLLPKYLYLTCTWLKKYLMYLMSSKYSEYLNLYLYLQIWKSTCTWLKYFKKYLTPTLFGTGTSDVRYRNIAFRERYVTETSPKLYTPLLRFIGHRPIHKFRVKTRYDRTVCTPNIAALGLVVW